MKEKNSIKIKFNNEYGNLQDYIYSIGVHPEKWGHIVFLGKDFTLKELKNIFLELIYNNIHNIKFITKANFKKYNYDFHNLRINIWEKEINQYIVDNGIEKKQFPNMPEVYSKENYIKINNPIIIKIESKNDFIRLNKIKPTSTYLISININLTVKDYLHLNQKINKIRKTKNLKIITEIIDF